MKRKIHPQRGSVLLTVIWTLAVLSIFTIAVNRQVLAELTFGKWIMGRMVGYALAVAGVQRAILELENDEFEIFDALNEKWASNQSVFKEAALGEGNFSVICRDAPQTEKEPRYGLCDESARININKAPRDVLKNLVKATRSEISDEDAWGIADAIVDWRDKDDATSEHGAEASDYSSEGLDYEPRNDDFQSVEEMQLVLGLTPEIYNSLSPFVTVYTPGHVNFNTAPLQVLQGLGMSLPLVERIVAFRKGSDAKEGTSDDAVFQDVETITSSLSAVVPFTPEEFAEISNIISANLVSVNSNVFRIYAIGRLIRGNQNFDVNVTAVARRNGIILYWREQ